MGKEDYHNFKDKTGFEAVRDVMACHVFAQCECQNHTHVQHVPLHTVHKNFKTKYQILWLVSYL